MHSCKLGGMTLSQTNVKSLQLLKKFIEIIKLMNHSPVVTTVIIKFHNSIDKS